MKPFFIFLLLFSLVGCQKSPIEPEEVKATLVDFGVGFVACSGGYMLQFDSGEQYTVHNWELPIPYNDETKIKFPASIWVRYKAPTGSCRQFPGLIVVTSIRAR